MESLNDKKDRRLRGKILIRILSGFVEDYDIESMCDAFNGNCGGGGDDCDHCLCRDEDAFADTIEDIKTLFNIKEW